jgi:hypothetical protein
MSGRAVEPRGVHVGAWVGRATGPAPQPSTWLIVQAVLPGFGPVGEADRSAPTTPAPEAEAADQPARLCPNCGLLKPIVPRRGRRRTGERAQWCADCRQAYRRARQRVWRRERYAQQPDLARARAKAWWENRRTEVLLAYGHACDCCADAAREFLAVDHIGGGGNQHRKRERLTSSRKFYGWLKRQGFPRDRFRLLCHNCNFAIGLYGYCPHQGRPQV